MNKLESSKKHIIRITPRRLIIVHRGANNDYTGSPGGPGTGFCGPGGGLVVTEVVASHHCDQD